MSAAHLFGERAGDLGLALLDVRDCASTTLDDGYELPSGFTVAADETVHVADGSVIRRDGVLARADGKLVLTDGTVTSPPASPPGAPTGVARGADRREGDRQLRRAVLERLPAHLVHRDGESGRLRLQRQVEPDHRRRPHQRRRATRSR